MVWPRVKGGGPIGEARGELSDRDDVLPNAGLRVNLPIHDVDGHTRLHQQLVTDHVLPLELPVGTRKVVRVLGRLRCRVTRRPTARHPCVAEALILALEGEADLVVLVDLPGHARVGARVKILIEGGPVGIGRVGPGRRGGVEIQAGEVVAFRVVAIRVVEPQTVFEERTTLTCTHVVGEVARRGLRRPTLGSAGQQSDRVKTERFAVEFVPARSRDGINDAAQHPAKFGLIAAFAHFDLAQKVVGEADALRVAGRLNHVDTVHEVGRLGSRRARQVGAVAEG